MPSALSADITGAAFGKFGRAPVTWVTACGIWDDALREVGRIVFKSLEPARLKVV